MRFYDAYNRMDDKELKRFALLEAKDLEIDAYGDLIRVLQDRKVEQNLIDEMQATYSKYSNDNIERVSRKFMESLCPRCNQLKGINAVKIDSLYSIIFYTKFKSSLIIGCYTCLKDELIQANISSLFLGPWGIPFGLLGTPVTILGNILKFKKIDMNVPSKELKEYVRKNIDIISGN